MRKINNSTLYGKKFGRWTVLCDGSPGLPAKLYCSCECGSLKNVNRDSLLRGLSTGCRKCSGMNGPSNPAYKGTKNIPGNYWGILQKSAKTRGIVVEISIHDLDDILVGQDFKCALTGLQISMSGSKKNSSWTGSADRIDSRLGYVKGNIQFVHKDVNLMKNRFSQERFIEICRLVASRIALPPEHREA